MLTVALKSTVRHAPVRMSAVEGTSSGNMADSHLRIRSLLTTTTKHLDTQEDHTGTPQHSRHQPVDTRIHPETYHAELCTHDRQLTVTPLPSYALQTTTLLVTLFTPLWRTWAAPSPRCSLPVRSATWGLRLEDAARAY